MKVLLFIAAMSVALLAGLAMAIVGGFGLLLLFPVVAAAFVISDYRIGVVLLAVMVPLSDSMLIPRAEGLNPFTYVSAAALAGFMLRKFLHPGQRVWPPRPLLFCIVVPLIVSVMMGVPHLDEGVRNLLKINPDARLDLLSYFRQYVYRPLLLVLFSVLLANAIVDSKKPGRFVVLFALSAISVVTYVVAFALFNWAGWGAHRLIISKAGMHYNEYGQLFALAFGPLLYVAFAERGAWRFFFATSALVVFVGLVFNFARAGMLAALVILALFLWQRRSVGVALVVASVMVIVILLAPEEWRARMLLGTSEVASSYKGERYGELTSGRLEAWGYLVSDVALSPLYGRGVGSTLWNSAVTSGLYPSSSHPHNMYLQVLLDLGVVGLGLVLYFFYRVLRAMRQLSRDQGLEPRLRAFFAGSWASLVGMLVLAFTGGHWFPSAEQGFLWMSMGLVFAYWHRTVPGSVRDSPEPAADRQVPMVSTIAVARPRYFGNASKWW